ncbi:MAG: hypothetical protein ACFB13_08015 [Kiloniellaceae bacterium]
MSRHPGPHHLESRRFGRLLLCRRLLAVAAALTLGLFTAAAVAQDAAYFTPTYAASQGSPYSDVYARAFGTPPAPVQAAPAQAAPLETSAPPPDAPPANPAASGQPNAEVVYVIEGSGLLTYRAEDYASGRGEAVSRSPLPPAETAYIGGAPDVQVPTIADRLYSGSGGKPALETAAGPAPQPSETGAPIPLTPPAD